jgi:hypothetical protein
MCVCKSVCVCVSLYVCVQVSRVLTCARVYQEDDYAIYHDSQQAYTLFVYVLFMCFVVGHLP